LRLIRADLIGQFRAMFDADREARDSVTPGDGAVVDDDPVGPAASPERREQDTSTIERGQPAGAYAA
jgi:hypothetical protein